MNRTVIGDLAAALKALGEHGDSLIAATATPEQLHQVGDTLARARRLLTDAGAPAPKTRCRRHPNGPVEPDTDGDCLLCRTRSKPTATLARREAPAADVLGVIDELGTDAAIRRYGGHAVNAALAAGNRSPATPWGLA
ncbi:hypothetical protein [Streptomyces anandii]|uniref:hypothetical protein n=1 Tax=Streptomyces anandii TaxID=285454 RepID=UPI00379601AE